MFSAKKKSKSNVNVGGHTDIFFSPARFKLGADFDCLLVDDFLVVQASFG